MEIGIIIGVTAVMHVGMRVAIRSIPYPPSLRRTLAKIIDPAAGASTWAFGSHM